jgi:hypothetical protein
LNQANITWINKALLNSSNICLVQEINYFEIDPRNFLLLDSSKVLFSVCKKSWPKVLRFSSWIVQQLLCFFFCFRPEWAVQDYIPSRIYMLVMVMIIMMHKNPFLLYNIVLFTFFSLMLQIDYFWTIYNY